VSKPKNTLLAFFLLASFSAVAEVLDRVLAVVGPDPILLSDLRARKQALVSSKVLASIYGIDPSKLTDQALLERMIEEKIVENATRELDIKVSDADVSKKVDTIAKSNNLNRRQLEESLRKEGIPVAAYQDNIRLQLQRRNVFEREIRKAGGVGDAELREAYRKRARREFDLVLVDIPAAEQTKVVSAFSRGLLPEEKLLADYPANDLGWTDTDSLRPELKSAVLKSGAGKLVGPVNVGGRRSFVFVRRERQGSEEEFQQIKGQLQAEAQSDDYEKRFQLWLDRKKRDMHIVVNK